MSERVAHKIGYKQTLSGYSFSLDNASLKLLSIILADKELQKLYAKYDLSHMEPFIEDIKETEIIKLLVEIATQYRIMEWNIRDEWKNKDFKTEVVGELFTDNKDEGQELDLTIREACNKVIHAEEIVFDITKLRGTKRYYYNPYIHIYGKKGKLKWKASIDLVLFCNAVNQQFEEPF